MQQSVNEVKALREALKGMIEMHDAMMKKVNHGASFYDADCIRHMNEAPRAASAALALSEEVANG